jgi:hypothetical protein
LIDALLDELRFRRGESLLLLAGLLQQRDRALFDCFHRSGDFHEHVAENGQRNPNEFDVVERDAACRPLAAEHAPVEFHRDFVLNP